MCTGWPGVRKQVSIVSCKARGWYVNKGNVWHGIDNLQISKITVNWSDSIFFFLYSIILIYSSKVVKIRKNWKKQRIYLLATRKNIRREKSKKNRSILVLAKSRDIVYIPTGKHWNKCLAPKDIKHMHLEKNKI